MKIKLTDKKITLIILFLTLLVLLLPFILRAAGGNLTLIGDSVYHHFNLIKNQNLLFQSNLFTPYSLILLTLNLIIQNRIWLIIIPLLLGVGSTLLLNNFLRNFQLTLEQRLFILIFFIFSPAFIYFFIFSTHFSLVIFLLLLVANILETKSKLRYLAIPVILTLGFFDIFTTLITLSCLLIYWLFKKNQTILYFFASLLLLAVLLQIFYPQPLIYEAWRGIDFFSDFFSDLGGLSGFSLFYLLLSLIGLTVTWKKRRIYYFTYLSAVLLLTLLFFNFNTNVYLNFILSFYAGLGFIWLRQKKWNLNFLKNLSILILLIGIILSTGNYILEASKSPPTIFTRESLIWLKDNSQSSELILSHSSKSFWIEAIAERKALVDFYDDNFKDKSRIADLIFNSRDLKLTVELLEENNIRYIWIDTEMMRGQIWNEKDEGLLFLFRNPKFKNIYAKKGIEIWKLE